MNKQDTARHPMQPLVRDNEGTVRFQENAIVRHLLDRYPGGLNELLRFPWTPDDYTQLMQLVGYSVSGFCELSGVPDGIRDVAHEKAQAMVNPLKTIDHAPPLDP